MMKLDDIEMLLAAKAYELLTKVEALLAELQDLTNDLHFLHELQKK